MSFLCYTVRCFQSIIHQVLWERHTVNRMEMIGMTQAECNPHWRIKESRSSSAKRFRTVVELLFAELQLFKDYPFHVVDDVHMRSTTQSIWNNSVIVPLIVRPRTEGGHKIISGHRRKRACEMIRRARVPQSYVSWVLTLSWCSWSTLISNEREYGFTMKFGTLKPQQNMILQLLPKSGISWNPAS